MKKEYVKPCTDYMCIKALQSSMAEQSVGGTDGDQLQSLKQKVTSFTWKQV